MVAYPSLVIKRRGAVSVNRAMRRTRNMVVNHLDALAAELIKTGIFTNSTQDEPGKWSGVIDTSRVFNHDETPQFVNYGIDGTASGCLLAEVTGVSKL